MRRLFACSVSHDLILKSFSPPIGSRPSQLDTAYTPSPPQSGQFPASPSDFTVSTYNVLSQSHVEQSDYPDTPPDILDAFSRLPHVAATIEGMNASVFCLQEADLPHAFWVPILNGLGYQCTFKLRRNNEGITGEGLVLAWRASEWRCLAQAGVEYFSYPRAQADRKDQVAICALLQHKVTGRTVVVTSTHLVFNTNRGDIKLGQAQCLLRGIEAWLAHLGISSSDISRLSLEETEECERVKYGMGVFSVSTDRMESIDWNDYAAPRRGALEHCKYVWPAEMGMCGAG